MCEGTYFTRIVGLRVRETATTVDRPNDLISSDRATSHIERGVRELLLYGNGGAVASNSFLGALGTHTQCSTGSDVRRTGTRYIHRCEVGVPSTEIP